MQFVKVGSFAMRKTRVRLNLDKYKAAITKVAVDEQTKRLVAYAQEKIALLGARIQMWESRNHMDRTGNLLDSLCWGVSYNGKPVKSGFYREQKASRVSYLHEFFGDSTWFPVGGHVLAQNFIKQMGNLHYNGWRVFFAILAPYWGYWEEGFMFKGFKTRKFLKFQVMTELYDVVSADLKPASVKLTVKVPKYTLSQLERTARNRDTRAARGGHDVYSKYKGKYKI